LDIHFDKNGRFTGQITGVSQSGLTLKAFGAYCYGDTVSDDTTDVAGEFDAKRGVIRLDLTLNGVSRPTTLTCEYSSGYVVQMPSPSVQSETGKLSVEMPALVDAPYTLSEPISTGSASHEFVIERR
jgi:hypothetical protein